MCYNRNNHSKNYILLKFKGDFYMAEQKIIIANVNDTERKWDSSLNWKIFEQNGEHKHSFELQRSTISSPFSTNGKLEVYFYTILPGKVNYPYHYHTANEEVFYIMSGQGTLKTPEGEKNVSEGDVIVMPAHENGAHQLINTSNSPLVYLEVKTSTIPEICIQPDSEKLVVIAPPKFFGKAFKIDSDVNYLDGE
jgi:uncharacterized cupin superfamily protein